MIIIYQSSKFSFSCVLLVESLSREIVAYIAQRARETIYYSSVNNKILRSYERFDWLTFSYPKNSKPFRRLVRFCQLTEERNLMFCQPKVLKDHEEIHLWFH